MRAWRRHEPPRRQRSAAAVGRARLRPGGSRQCKSRVKQALHSRQNFHRRLIRLTTSRGQPRASVLGLSVPGENGVQALGNNIFQGVTANINRFAS